MTRGARKLRNIFRVRYAIGLMLIATLSVISLFIFFEKTSLQSGRSEILNIASSQKALSQRIAFSANRLAVTTDITEQQNVSRDLLDSIQAMRDAHTRLSGMSNSTTIERRQLETIREIYFNESAPFDRDVTLFLDTAETLAVERMNGSEISPIHLSEINLLGTHTIMQVHDVIATIIAYETEQEISRFKTVQLILVGTILFLILIETILIFEPMGRRIEEAVRVAENAHTRAQEEAARATRANEVRANFLRMMSHELRTPLNAVIGMAKLLRAGTLDSQQDTYARYIEEAGNHILTVTNDVTTFNQQVSGELKLNNAPHSLYTEINTVIDVLRPKAEEKGFEIKASLDAIVGRKFAYDAHRIRQVIFNILSNAVKFTQQGRVLVAAQCQPDPDDADVSIIELRFYDTGSGIDPSKKEEIFEEFKQAQALGTRGYSGAGLGLAISRNIVEQSGGELILEKSSAAGSVFLVKLPLKNAGSVSQENDTNSHEKTPANDTTKILVVDDNLPNRMIAAAYLKKAGFSIVFAENGQEAIDQYNLNSDISLILMDIEMPVMDGVTATKTLRKNHADGPHLPIIALTAHALPEDCDALRADGFDDVMFKPTTEREIVKYTKRYIQRSQAA